MTWAGQGLKIGLFGVSVVLCLVIATEVSGFRPGGASYPVPTHVAAVARLDPADPVGAPDRHEAWLNEILARPLFNPNRRPVEVGVRGLPRLTGIVVAGSQRVAIFAGPANGHPIVAPPGAHVGAYEVQTVADAGVTVVGPEGTTLIKPIFDVARPSGPVPPPAASARPQPARPAAK